MFWVQHSDDALEAGSDEWQYIDELRFGADEPVLHKEYGDSFEGANAHTTEDMHK